MFIICYSHKLSNLIFTQFFKVGSILIFHFADELIEITEMKDPVPNHRASNGGLPAEPTLLTIMPPGKHCYR